MNLKKDLSCWNDKQGNARAIRLASIHEISKIRDSSTARFRSEDRADSDKDLPAAKKSPLILVVDDDPMIRLLAQETLQAADYRVVVAADGIQALEIFDRHKPDLVLCDVMMPRMDGFLFCEKVRQARNEPFPPIVMLTGLNDIDSIEKGLAAGATDFSIKPVSWPLLPHRVHYILHASEAMQRLRFSEERYSLAARGANDGLWDWDLNTSAIYYSPRWKSMLGFSESTISDSPGEWVSRIHPDDVHKFNLDLTAHMEGRACQFMNECRVCCADGSYRWMMSRGLAVRDDEGKAYRIAGSMSDITIRKEAEEKLLFDAFHDKLTDLPNRALFLDRLSHSMALAQRRFDYRFAVFFLDLDRFKLINDSLGHLMGDRLLRIVSKRIQSILRSGDTLARLGGDEFVILYEEIDDEKSVMRLAERIHEALSRPIDLDGQKVVSRASIGIVFYKNSYKKPEEILRDADIAMYRAKKSGARGHEIFDAKMHQQVVGYLKLETDLRSAIKERQFEVYYQPIIDLSNDKISGFEALVRWLHPERGLLLPEEFMKVAEETRIIVPLGRWVIRQASRQIQKWRSAWADAKDWYISINISSPELAQPDFVSAIKEALEETELCAGALKIEITESSLIDNNKHALATMNALRDLGVGLSIDDFGTGYSSFNYLRLFPFDVLKIDRSFISNMEPGSEREEIVKTIINLAHNLGMQVVAEGSETRRVLTSLRNLPCEYAQGYSILEPMCAESVTSYIDRKK